MGILSLDGTLNQKLPAMFVFVALLAGFITPSMQDSKSSTNNLCSSHVVPASLQTACESYMGLRGGDIEDTALESDTAIPAELRKRAMEEPEDATRRRPMADPPRFGKRSNRRPMADPLRFGKRDLLVGDDETDFDKRGNRRPMTDPLRFGKRGRRPVADPPRFGKRDSLIDEDDETDFDKRGNRRPMTDPLRFGKRGRRPVADPPGFGRRDFPRGRRSVANPPRFGKRNDPVADERT